MTDIDKDRLLYRPDLRPSKNYLSDGNFLPQDVPPVTPEEEQPKDNTPKKIYDDLKEIIKMMPLLPDEVAHLRPSLEKIQKRITIVYPEGYITPDTPEERRPAEKELPDEINQIGHIPIENNPALKKLPNLFPKTNNVVLKIEQPKTLVQLIDAAYAKDQVDLDKYYIQKLQTIMQQYFQQMMALMADSGVSAMDDLTQDFNGDQIKVPAGQGLEHLRDYIVRSQVKRNQMSRLFKKTHSVDRTLMHMRSWHAANEQRKRYYSEEYKDSTSFTDSHSNSLLRESRATYDTAYSSALYDMYKYLNSSVMITNDILNTTVKEAQAKAELMKNGVDIFAVDQEEVEFARQVSNAGQTGDGKGSGFDESEEQKENSKESDSADKSSNSDKDDKSSGTSDFWDDIVKTTEKNVTSSANKFGSSVLNSNDISKAAKEATNDVLSNIKSTPQNSTGTLLNSIATQSVTVYTPKKTVTNEADKKNDASKFPVYNQINEDDDALTRRKKRVAQIKQELADIQSRLKQIKSNSKEYKTLVKQQTSLQEEYSKLSSE